MTTQAYDDVRAVAARRQIECMVLGIGYDSRMHFLSKINWVTIIVPALLSLFAGGAIFAGGVWTVFGGAAALLSALLIMMHKGRNGAADQAECGRLSREYIALSAKFRTLQDVETGNLNERMLALDDELASIRKSAGVDLPESERKQAAFTLGQIMESQALTGRPPLVKH